MSSVAEKKSVVGLRDLYYALVTQDDADAYAAAAPAAFAPAVTASQKPTTNAKTQYADDGVWDVLVNEGETKLALEVTGISLDVLATALGKGYDASTGRMFDNGGTPPDVALSFRAMKSNGSYKYFQYLRGKFSAPEEDQATKTDTPDPKNTKIDFTAVKTIHQFTLVDDEDNQILDGVKRVVGDEDSANFDGSDWFTAVQVPVVGTPTALSFTHVPANGSSNNAVDVAIALTFSNPLAGNAEVGVAMMREDNHSSVTLTRTLSANRKVLTLGHASLTAGKTYDIVVAGVKDIYGQILADAARYFTVAS